MSIKKKKNALTVRIGQRIAALRKQAGLSQQDVEDKSGVRNGRSLIKFRTLSLIEQGYGEPKITTLDAIASTLGCSLSDLLNIEPSAQVPETDADRINQVLNTLTPEQQRIVLAVLSALVRHA